MAEMEHRAELPEQQEQPDRSPGRPGEPGQEPEQRGGDAREHPHRGRLHQCPAGQARYLPGDLGGRRELGPAAVSGAVRYLIQIGMLAREPVPGSRRDRYRLPDDAWYQASSLKGGLYKMIVDMAGEGVTALGGDQTASGARVAELRDVFVFLQAGAGALLDTGPESR